MRTQLSGSLPKTLPKGRVEALGLAFKALHRAQVPSFLATLRLLRQAWGL